MTISRTVIFGAVIAALCAQRLYHKLVAYQTPLNKANFAHAEFTVEEVPTTYYSVRKIGDVLKEWDHSFHLYRLHPNETFDFDFTKANSKVRAKALLDKCPWNSSICRPCFDSDRMVQEVDTNTIFKENGWYASFAKISESAVAQLWDMMRFPFDVSTTQLEHAFISNLAQPMVTAGIHANPMTSSMGVQFVGKKTWLFFDPQTYRDAMEATPTAPILLPRRSPKKPYKVFVYTSQPGDVIFFTESWAHIVYTYDGPNVMINYRKFNPLNFFRQPFTWLAASINNFRSPLIHKAGRVAGNDLQQQSVPEKQINFDAYLEVDKLCSNGVLTEFDKDMMNLMVTAYEKHGKK